MKTLVLDVFANRSDFDGDKPDYLVVKLSGEQVKLINDMNALIAQTDGMSMIEFTCELDDKCPFVANEFFYFDEYDLQAVYKPDLSLDEKIAMLATLPSVSNYQFNTVSVCITTNGIVVSALDTDQRNNDVVLDSNEVPMHQINADEPFYYDCGL